MRLVAGVAVVFFVCAGAVAGDPAPRSLSFEDRVRAQEAIERVYYAHQLGATKPFEAAVPRLVLENKVRKYLEQTEVLRVFWKTAVTDYALQRELARIAAGTKMPERLHELYAALDNDPRLIRECLARATLVDRLTRNFEALDLESAKPLPPDEPLTAASARATAGCASDGWDNRSLDDGPEPLGGPSSVWTGSEMLVWSGETPGRGFRYDPATDHWAPMSVIGAPAPRYGFSVIWAGASMIVWGGSSGSYPYPFLASGARYDPIADSWTATSTSGAPSARNSHTVVWTGSRMVVWGGYDGSHHVASGGLYDPSTDTWSATANAGAPSARTVHSAVWTGSAMIVFGGYSDVEFDEVNTGGRYDPIANTWLPTSTVGAPRLTQHTAVWTGSTMIVWNGFDGGRYDLASDSWLPVSTTNAPVGRWEQTAVWTGSSMVVWGGRTPSGALFNAGARYDPVADQWTPTSTVNAPSARGRHTAVWTGQLMVVWGGYIFNPDSGFTNFLSSGGRYDPATDTWTPTATGPAGAPSPRSGHTAVWTGNQMLVWGGDDTEPSGVGPLGNGGRYDPATDSWTSIAMANAPGPRVSHTAVWTGSAMIVWGGGDFDLTVDTYHLFKTGGRYDPVSDSWTPTSIIGAPEPRQNHTAVWTGSKMVVWGGVAEDYSTLSTGGRYDPTTDTWAPTATAGAPSERALHSAVWTGSTMVVWGGAYIGDVGSTGGRYDPAADSWLPTSTLGAPVPRYGHAAIWTGSAMLIWGGTADSPPFDGASYDPATNSWQPMTRIGQPAALYRNSAVWTGNEMVVWGGVDHDAPYSGGNYHAADSGGRYDPATGLWRATTTVGAPSGRYDHSAVWTGSRMVVWGGTRVVAKLATGGSYFVDGLVPGECDGDGYTVADGDCNDDDPSVHPGAAETCNGADENCDGTIDEGGDALCDDVNSCTSDTCQPQGGCVHVPLPAETPCDDDYNMCTGYESCDGYGYCYSSYTVHCFSDDNPCTLDYCDPQAGCSYVLYPAGHSCSDGNPCNGSEVCDGYACEPGTPVPAPAEVVGLTASADKTTYSWSTTPAATEYDIVRGRTVTLPVGPGFGDEVCFHALSGASITDTSIPAAGIAYWYLARGENNCAVGTYGTASDGSPRLTTTCPAGIGDSPLFLIKAVSEELCKKRGLSPIPATGGGSAR